ncbi:hypothetical protein AZE42_09881 [Rhizopogon vesiculosus]|uniref:Uncharacterized protein n=1 Tax=Rhizopogon vesiculosus TaxID=180088 RepID=A0A1J8Q6U8_9AGAM|nr:hypothetical protein AZE42_09881 [Rhizopogon vesiculosus]
MFQGIQRRPDGAGPPVETPVNAAQGVNNANLNQSRFPLPMNDPFMDTAPVGHRFDCSALGLYGDEGHVMYNFGGLQQSGTTNQMRPAHQFESSPPAGYNPHSVLFSKPESRGHSIPLATPMIELHERLGTMATANTGKSVAGKKNISNIHPGLESFRNDPKKKPEMKGEDYDRVIISTMAKSYWRNLNYLSYVEDQLRDDSASRRKEQNLGKGSRKAVGLEWRSLNHVTFLWRSESLMKKTMQRMISTS